MAFVLAIFARPITTFPINDLQRFYLPVAQGCLECGTAPYHASWILWPLTLIPPEYLNNVWMLLSVLALAWACWRLETEPMWVFLSVFTLGQLADGQVDALIWVGLTLTVSAKNPYARGTGILLASVKPHLSAIAILVVLWHEWREQDGWWSLAKVLIVPGAVLALSMATWGVGWPVDWLLHHNKPDIHPWRYTTLFPWGLGLLSLLPLWKEKRERVQAALWISAIGMPYFASYSFVVPLVFGAPWWTAVISYGWLLLGVAAGLTHSPLLITSFVWAMYVLPAAMLAWMVRHSGKFGSL